MEKIDLNANASVPILGFGTWKLQGDVCEQAVLDALKVGFRHLDTADSYANHKKVGAAIRRSSLPREEIFLTTKLWHEKLTKEEVKDCVQRFLEELQVNYIDLLLIHWPNHLVPIEETLEAMNRCKEDGVVKAIGVSNFTIKHLEETKKTGFEVSVNQIEFHPSFNQKELKEYCDHNKITIEAHSPNGQGRDLLVPEIIDIARKHFATEYQAILAWLRQKGIVALPKSTNPKHMRENLESLKLNLKDNEIEVIENLPQGERVIDFAFSEFKS